jgi:uncharacterized membrane protein
LLATVVWLGGITLITLLAWPAMQRGTLAGNQWWELQRRFAPWANGSLILLLITGFFQMTNDANYSGFLNIDGRWAVAILLKHIAFAAMVAITAYMQAALYPAMSRTAFLAEKKPEQAAAEHEKIQQREIRLLRLNLAFAVIVLLLTAVATAV